MRRSAAWGRRPLPLDNNSDDVRELSVASTYTPGLGYT